MMNPARLRARHALAGLLLLVGLAGVPTASAAESGEPRHRGPTAGVGAVDLPLLAPRRPAAMIAPVAAPTVADPVGAVRGTMIMVHAGGWAGHDAHAQDLLMERPGQQLLSLGWRIVSLDYEEGTAGLHDVLNTLGAEQARQTGAGPICIYGESAGGHLALVAASQQRAIDCVIALGPPMDLRLYRQEAAASADSRLKLVAHQIGRFFGTTDAENAAWDPASLAPRIHSDVLLFHEEDDFVVSAQHNLNFTTNRVTTQNVQLVEGGVGDAFVHGTVSAAGRAVYRSEIAAFTERAITSRRARAQAAGLGCKSADRAIGEISSSRVRAALRCLALKDKSLPARSGSWRRTSFRAAGEVSAARIWATLRSTTSGRRALTATAARRVTLRVRSATRSRIILSKKR